MSFWQRSRFLLGLTAGTSAIFCASAGWAAEKVVLKYGVIQSSIPVADLVTFAQTGVMSSDLEKYGVSGKEAQDIRIALTKEIAIDPVLLDRGLNNPLGNLLLDEVGQSIQTPVGVANREALRSALILAASNDRKISLLEAIQKYPTPEVHVDVKKLSQTYSRVSKLESQIRQVMSLIKLF